MQISKSRLSRTIKEQILINLFQVFTDLNTIEDVKSFMESFYSKDEIITAAKRLAVACSLEKGDSYEEIKNMFRVSSATIANVDKIKNQNKKGFNIAFERLEAEHWAGELAKKISNTVGKIIKKD